jgi:predicted metal-dependent hydrolase
VGSSTRGGIDALVREGIAAYARGEHFAAHEHFEHAWLAGGVARSRELHALAQLAAAVYKDMTQEKPEAARAIMRRARAKLDDVETSAYGIDLVRLRELIDRWLTSGGGAPELVHDD